VTYRIGLKRTGRSTCEGGVRIDCTGFPPEAAAEDAGAFRQHPCGVPGDSGTVRGSGGLRGSWLM